MGYVGLPLALLFSGEAFRRHRVRYRGAKGQHAQCGRLLHCAHSSRTRFSRRRSPAFAPPSNYADIAQMDAIIICVPTPLNEYHEPDLSYVTGTVESIAPHLREGQLVVLESTTYPGTTEEIVVPLIEKGNRHGLRSPALWMTQGFTSRFRRSAKIRAMKPSHVTTSPRSLAVVVRPPPSLRPRTMAPSSAASFRSAALRSAEMTKLLENIYRCVNIALVNELKQLCMRMGIDIHEVIDAAKDQAIRLPGVLSGSRPRRPLHSHRPLLSFVEG